MKIDYRDLRHSVFAVRFVLCIAAAAITPGMSVSGAVVTNHTDTTFVDYNDAWKSVARGAHAGRNYVVWYHNA